MHSRSCAFAAILAGLTVPAQAAPLTFYGEDLRPVTGTPITGIPSSTAARSAFEAMLATSWQIDDEGADPSSPETLVLLGPGAVTTDFTGDMSFGVSAFGAFAGSQMIFGEAFTLANFSQPMNGVGLFAISTNNSPPAPAGRLPEIVLTIDWSDSSTEVFTSPVTLVDETFAQYFAVFDPVRSFSRIVVNSPADNIFTGSLDLLTFGVAASQPVPAPPALALFAVGLVGLLTGRQRLARA